MWRSAEQKTQKKFTTTFLAKTFALNNDDGYVFSFAHVLQFLNVDIVLANVCSVVCYDDARILWQIIFQHTRSIRWISEKTFVHQPPQHAYISWRRDSTEFAQNPFVQSALPVPLVMRGIRQMYAVPCSVRNQREGQLVAHTFGVVSCNKTELVRTRRIGAYISIACDFLIDVPCLLQHGVSSCNGGCRCSRCRTAYFCIGHVHSPYHTRLAINAVPQAAPPTAAILAARSIVSIFFVIQIDYDPQKITPFCGGLAIGCDR